MTLTEYIAQVEARLRDATPGPYDVRVREFSNHALTEVWTEFGWYSQLPRDYREPTTELFAHAPMDLARLLKIVALQNEALEAYAKDHKIVMYESGVNHDGTFRMMNKPVMKPETEIARSCQAKVQEVLK